MANWSATLATLGALVRPQSLQPSLVVPSIAHLDWHALKHRAHVHAVVIDKDNCIARPDEDTLADDDALRASWDRLLAEFGPDRVLVVSNSAGDLRKDPLRIQAETVSRNLGVPVLVHSNPKPAYACAKQIAAHFLLAPNSTDRSVADDVVYSPLARARARNRAIEAVETMPTTTTGTRLRSQLAAAAESGSDGALSSTPPPPPPSSVFRVLVIGDRLTTDMILARRLSSLSLPFSTRRVPSPSPPTTSPPPVSWLSHFRLWPSSSSTRRLFPSTISIGQDGQTIESVGILTTRLWGREGAGTTLMRTVEKMAVRAFEKRKARARARRGRVTVAVGDEEKGARPDWREFTTGLRIESPTQEELLVTKPEVPVPATAPPASATTSRPPLWQRLPSLDFAAVRSFPSRIPTLASSFVHSIPDRVHNLTTATFRTLVRALELYGPRMIATTERGLQKLVDVYLPAQPQEIRERRLVVPSAPIERALDRVEQRWEEAGQTLDRYRERWDGTAASVRAMAMAARRRTGGGGGVAVPAAQEEVQGKEATARKGSAVR